MNKNDNRYDAEGYKNRAEWLKSIVDKYKDEMPPVSEKIEAPFASFPIFKNSKIVFTANSKNRIIDDISTAIISDPRTNSLDETEIDNSLKSNWDEIFNRLQLAIQNGRVTRYSVTPTRANQISRAKGEMTLVVSVARFDLPGLEIPIRGTITLGDNKLTGTMEPELVVRFFKAEVPKDWKMPQKKVAWHKFASQMRPYQLMKNDELTLAKALQKGYQKAFGEPPSLELLAFGWAQSVLERHPNLGLPHYNIGNIKATSDWIKAGKPYFVKSTKEIDKEGKEYTEQGTKWRAYDTIEDGAAGYWKLIGGRFKNAMPFIQSGRPVQAAASLGKSGYYTANVEKYSSNVGKLYNKFMTDIAPKLGYQPSLSAPEPTPSLSSATEDESDVLIDKLFAKKSLQNIVKLAILEENLPVTGTLVSLSNLSAPYGVRVRFAKALAKTLAQVLDSKVKVRKIASVMDDKIELYCETLGTQYNVNMAIQALCDCVNYAFCMKQNKYKISYLILPANINKYNLLKV